MVSLDLKDAYLQVPIHPESRQFLRFSTAQGSFQFNVLCFGRTTSPQVFTRVMAPVSVMLHSLGIRMLRYLDDWLIQAASRDFCIWERDQVMQLCKKLGIVINLVKSQLIPTQTATYLGMEIDSRSLRVSPTQKRIVMLNSLKSFCPPRVSPQALGGRYWVTVIHDSVDSWGSPQDEVPSACTKESLGFQGRSSPSRLESPVSPGSGGRM